MKKRIAVLGDGAFGTAFAHFIAQNGYEVNLWCHNKLVYDSIKNTGVNNIYLPEIKLNSNIFVTQDISQALNNTDIVFEAIPTQFLNSSLSSFSDILSNKIICILTKGIDSDSLVLPSDIIENILKQNKNLSKNNKLVVISGPSFARDLALSSPTGLVAASKNKDALTVISQVLNKNIYLEFTEDIIGVQVAGAVKNVIALGVGILDGAGYNDNTKALFFYKSLAEIKALINNFGGNPDSVYLLSGIGDLVLTAFMSQGRNKQVGFNIGQGKKICDILNQADFVPEGANTLKSINEIIEKNSLNLPICKSIYNIVYEDFNVETLISKLF